MNSEAHDTIEPRSADDREVRALYQQLLDAWNDRSATGFAALCIDDAYLVGFDGSQMLGRAEIETTFGQIIADHVTAAYIGIVRGVRILTPEVAVLRAVAGLVPRGQTDLNPAVNAVQTLVAVKQAGTWKVAVYQNTPAAFHGRPELSDALTQELRDALLMSSRQSRQL